MEDTRRGSARMQAGTNRLPISLRDHLPLRDPRADIISSDDDYDAEFVFHSPSLSQTLPPPQSSQMASTHAEIPGPVRRPSSRATHRNQPYHPQTQRSRDGRSDGDSLRVSRPSSSLSEPVAGPSNTRTREQGIATGDRTPRSVTEEGFSSAAQLLSQMQSDIRSGRLVEPGVGRRGEEGRIENGRVIPTRESTTPSPQRLPLPMEGFRPFSRSSSSRALMPLLQRQPDHESSEWSREASSVASTSSSSGTSNVPPHSRPAGPRFVPLGARDLSQFPRVATFASSYSRSVTRVVRFSELLGGGTPSLNAVNARDAIDLSMVSHPSHSYISAPATAPTEVTGTDERVEVVKTESTAVRRLRKEAEQIRKQAPLGCSAAPKEGDLYEWSAVVEGPPDTVYEGGTFFMDISFNDEYPNSAPKVTFLTRIYHCNINAAGHVCVDVLRDKWRTEMNIGTILESILTLMYSCNPEDPLVIPIAAQFRQNRDEFDKTAKIWTIRYAT